MTRTSRASPPRVPAKVSQTRGTNRSGPLTERPVRATRAPPAHAPTSATTGPSASSAVATAPPTTPRTGAVSRSSRGAARLCASRAPTATTTTATTCGHGLVARGERNVAATASPPNRLATRTRAAGRTAVAGVPVRRRRVGRDLAAARPPDAPARRRWPVVDPTGSSVSSASETDDVAYPSRRRLELPPGEDVRSGADDRAPAVPPTPATGRASGDARRSRGTGTSTSTGAVSSMVPVSRWASATVSSSGTLSPLMVRAISSRRGSTRASTSPTSRCSSTTTSNRWGPTTTERVRVPEPRARVVASLTGLSCRWSNVRCLDTRLPRKVVRISRYFQRTRLTKGSG